jgi:hypothetical protein
LKREIHASINMIIYALPLMPGEMSMKRFINNQGTDPGGNNNDPGIAWSPGMPFDEFIYMYLRIINSVGENELRVFQTAQYYMEETRSMDEIDMELFLYNSEKNNYERYISDALDDYSIEIRLIPARYGMHYIEVDVIKDYETVYALKGSIIL